MTSVTIEVDKELLKIVDKRAEKNLQTRKELIEDIVRRSMITWKGKPASQETKIDDKLVSIFSKDTRGRKKKGK